MATTTPTSSSRGASTRSSRPTSTLAQAAADEAQRLVLAGERNWKVLDLVALQGLLAHRSGSWFDRMRLELRRTRENPEIANAIFDGYLCPAEYMLYGPTPYAEVIAVARDLQTTARRSGALRAAAFASALIGEAALLSGDLELAAAELTEASDLHRDLGSAAGEAHSLQRLAEVRVAEGDGAAAMRLLQQALPLARASMIAKHLLQRIFGTMILAASDPLEARAIVDRAESTLGWDDACHVLLDHAVGARRRSPAHEPVISEHARRHLAIAEAVGACCGRARRGRRAWPRRRPRSRRPSGDLATARQRMQSAAEQFERAGQPLDAERCRRADGRVAARVTGAGQQAVLLPSDDQPQHRSGRRGEQFEGDVVGVAERQARAVAGVDDLAVGDAELVEAGGPLDELAAARAAERDVVETGPALVERLLAGEIGEAVQPEQRVADRVDDVPERAGVLVEDRCDAEDLRVPGLADGEVGHGHGDVGDGGHGW